MVFEENIAYFPAYDGDSGREVWRSDGTAAGTWRVRDIWSGTGSGVTPFSSDDSGLFFFFSADNWEMLVKVLDACAVNGHKWVFAAATTDVAFTLEAHDTGTGRRASYTNPLGNAADAIIDIQALPCSGD